MYFRNRNKIIFTLFSYTKVQQLIKTGSFKVVLFLVLYSFSLCNISYAQKKNTDSARIATQQALEASRLARQKSLDSARAVRQRTVDSMNAVRKKRADSLTAIRKYKESRRYKDSVARARQERLDSLKDIRTAYFDSVRAVRDRVSDSIALVRQHHTDSIRAIQKHRSDSLAVISKYRNSKRYKDSVAFVRQARADSARTARAAASEIAAAARKASLDSAAAVRKEFRDSVTAVRKAFSDSVAAVRKDRADSLAKVKEAREKLKKTKEKQKEEKSQLALELKIKKKHEAWSNEKMLKKKWSAPRRALQNTFTHYNYYFNADRKMDEALENMQRVKKEDYDSLIAIFPFDPDMDSSALAADMDSIIQKASLGIQIHDPRTKWADDLYLLLGQAYYYKGNYTDAANSFRYIISMNQQKKMKEQKEAAAKKKTVDKDVSILEPESKSALDFLKHKEANNEAVLWLARTYTEAHKENEAESILDLLQGDKNLDKELQGRLALEKAYLNLGRKNYGAVSDQLTEVVADHSLPQWLRTRAAYLNGQLFYRQGNYVAASENFQEVIDLSPKIELDFQARKNLAYSLMQQGGSQEKAVASLRKMLNDGKYAPYYEQVYYVLGRLSENNKNPADAITYLRKSLETPKTTKKQKAASFASLGNVYYNLGRYQEAKQAYDSAAFLARSAPGDEQVATAAKRSKFLDKIVVPMAVIRQQDSLIALAGLTEKEQKTIVRRYLRSLETRMADSIARAEAGASEDSKKEAAEPGGIDWYFSNPVLLQQGVNDFKRKWGTRPNVDNWRRAAGLPASRTTASNAVEEGEDKEGNGMPTEAELLAAIPRTAEQQGAVRLEIQKAYIDLGNAYVKDLEDYPRGIQTLDTLDLRFSGHEHQAEALYIRYLAALKQDKLAEAQALSDRLLKEYSSTSWAKLVTPSEDKSSGAASAVPVAEYYDETYSLMQDRQFGSVLQRSREGRRLYKDSVYLNRFRIMEAIAMAGSGNLDQADTIITEFIAKHPVDSLRSWADAVKLFIKNGKLAAHQDSVDKALKGLQPGIDSLLSIAPPPADYTYNVKGEHYFVFFFNKMESKTMGVKAALGDFNTFKYSSNQLHTDLHLFPKGEGVIIVSTFPTAALAQKYRSEVGTDSRILKEYKQGEYRMLVISSENFRKLKADKVMDPYLVFYDQHYK